MAWIHCQSLFSNHLAVHEHLQSGGYSSIVCPEMKFAVLKMKIAAKRNISE